ncbi:hypothetical protein [Streptoalloteichus hindustanus]|nr:hypothetical protein [Streptoalloteichus hindustanus]
MPEAVAHPGRGALGDAIRDRGGCADLSGLDDNAEPVVSVLLV